ncbi:MAG: type II-A CRISPR-associated protein Csn2 [Enterococcus sp.]
MKMNFNLLDVPFELEKSTVLVVEDTLVFTELMKQLYCYSPTSDLKIFDAKYTALKVTEMMVVTDILGYEINSLTTLKLIYTDLEQQLNEKPELKSEIEQLATTITDLISAELIEHEMDLEMDEITINELFKALGIKIETTSDSIFEKMLEIIQVYTYLSKKKLLVFVNTCVYLTKQELKELVDYIKLSNVDVLFLEPRLVSGVKQFVLDEDYFLTTETMI